MDGHLVLAHPKDVFVFSNGRLRAFVHVQAAIAESVRRFAETGDRDAAAFSYPSVRGTSVTTHSMCTSCELQTLLITLLTVHFSVTVRKIVAVDISALAVIVITTARKCSQRTRKSARPPFEYFADIATFTSRTRKGTYVRRNFTSYFKT
jgi:hypothetical protein